MGVSVLISESIEDLNFRLAIQTATPRDVWPLDAGPLGVGNFQMRVFELGSNFFKIHGFYMNLY